MGWSSNQTGTGVARGILAVQRRKEHSTSLLSEGGASELWSSRLAREKGMRLAGPCSRGRLCVRRSRKIRERK
jgi:hypothetical protein